MERRKVVILVVLLLLVILYIVTLGYGLAKGDQQRSFGSVTDGFASVLQGMLSSFTPKLDGNRLECNNQRLNTSFKLTQSSSRCVIDMASAKPSEETYSKGTLSVVQPGPKPPVIYVRSTKSDTKSTAGVTINCQPDSSARARSRLEVTYMPDGDDPDDICWIEQKLTASERKQGKRLPDVGIVVMQEDRHPTLTLTRICNGCQASEHTIWLKWN